LTVVLPTARRIAERVDQPQRGFEAAVILVQDQVHALEFTQLLHELRANVGSE